MKVAILIFLILIVAVLSYEVYSFWDKAEQISQEFDKVKLELGEAKFDQEKLKAELDYLSNPYNLEKELRARFNLREPGEKLIIIVPSNNINN
ncbi:MAG: hypothetical protein Q7R86_00675 [bacterium]|nr:hypothetical protein [bacterium]